MVQSPMRRLGSEFNLGIMVMQPPAPQELPEGGGIGTRGGRRGGEEEEKEENILGRGGWARGFILTT